MGGCWLIMKEVKVLLPVQERPFLMSIPCPWSACSNHFFEPPAVLESTGFSESYLVLEQLRDSGVADEVRSEGKEILIIPELGNLYALSGLTAV